MMKMDSVYGDEDDISSVAAQGHVQFQSAISILKHHLNDNHDYPERLFLF